MRWYQRLFRRARTERQLDAELRFHLERQIADYVTTGMSPEEARRRARLEFGGLDQVKEECRDVGAARFVESLIQDVRYGLRQLRRNPGFTAVAIITLALGIGANTAIFSLIDAVMFKMLPVQQPQQLVVLNWASQGHPYFIHGIDGWLEKDKSDRYTSTAFSYPVFETIRARNHVFSGVFGFYGDDTFNVSAGGQAAVAPGEFVSGAYFSTLGVKAVIGRTLTPADDISGASPAAVISSSYWMNRFGGDPAVIGKAITVNDVPFTLVGVAAPKFGGLQPGRLADVWIPLHTHPQVDRDWWWLPNGQSIFSAGGEWWVAVVGRLKSGVTDQQASAQVTAILQQATAGIEKPPAHRPFGVSLKAPHVEVTSAANGMAALRREFSRPLLVLMALVALVLLIACANVASLLLARSTSRRREVAVRIALGAGRRRLIRQLLTESVLLSATGGLIGVILAYWASDALLGFMRNASEPAHLQVSPDLRVLAFTGIVSALTGILFGLAPALSGTRFDLTPALKERAGGAIGTGHPLRGMRFGLRDALVASQIAIALLLLIGAGLFIRTFRKLADQDLGFEHRNLLLFSIDPTQAGYKGEKLAIFYRELQRRIEAVPGVLSASLSRHWLVNDGWGGEGISIQGYTPKPGEEIGNGSIDTYLHLVGSRFFQTYGIPLLLGRTINDGDIEGSPKVGVINHAFARKYFGNAYPIGRRFGFGGEKNSSDIAIVGVVGDTTYGDLRQPPPPTIYVPYAQRLTQLGAMNFEVRTARDPKNWINPVRRTVHRLDKRLPLSDVETQHEQIDRATFEERLFASLTSIFGVLALVLACVGLYGAMAYAVARRTNEIGVRMALGAQKRDVLRLVLGQGMILALIGVGIGILGALGFARFLASLLYGVKATDPITFIAVSLILTIVALLACYIPARRAAKVDPMIALRHE